jgi:hypothetical protein
MVFNATPKLTRAHLPRASSSNRIAMTIRKRSASRNNTFNINPSKFPSHNDQLNLGRYERRGAKYTSTPKETSNMSHVLRVTHKQLGDFL